MFPLVAQEVCRLINLYVDTLTISVINRTKLLIKLKTKLSSTLLSKCLKYRGVSLYKLFVFLLQPDFLPKFPFPSFEC